MNPHFNNFLMTSGDNVIVFVLHIYVLVDDVEFNAVARAILPGG
jgi:hypothetical protein